MIAIAEMWPFSPKEAHASTGGPAILKEPEPAPVARKFLGKGIKTAKGEGGIGRVLGKIGKRNKMLAAAAGND